MEEKEIEEMKKENAELKVKLNSLLQIVPKPTGGNNLKEIFVRIKNQKFSLIYPIPISYSDIHKAIARISAIIADSEEHDEQIQLQKQEEHRKKKTEEALAKKELEEKTEKAQKE